MLNALMLHECESHDMLYEGADDKTEEVKDLIRANDSWIRNDYESFVESLRKSKRLSFLTPYTPKELKRKGAQTFQLDGYSIGYALIPTEDGEIDITSVHNNEDGVRNIADVLLDSAKKNGGTQLDHFDGKLSDIYSRNGFVEYERWPFDDRYAPEDWDYDTYGRPDVVFRRVDKQLKESLSFFRRLNLL